LQKIYKGAKMQKSTVYHNAKDVLPAALLAEIQRHFTGHLWVPTAESNAVKNRQRVIQLHKAGIGTHAIAEMVEMSQRRVQQIIQSSNNEGGGNVC
jgi:hypothetical protein